MNKENFELTDAVLVSHILNECGKITNLVSRISFEELEADVIYQDALTRELEIIGEAAGNLSTDFVKRFPEIPVRDMRAMRNVLAHQYFRVDMEYLWETAVNEIPPLFEALKRIKNEL